MTNKPSTLFSGLLLCAAGMALQTGIASAQQTLLSENFEGPNWSPLPLRLTYTAVNGWTGNDDWTSDESPSGQYVLSRVVSAPTDSPSRIGSQSLYLRDQSKTTSAQANYRLGSTLSNGYIQFDFKQAVGSGGFYLYMLDSSSNNNVIFLISGTNIGIRSSKSGATDNRDVSFADAGYSFGDWDTFRISFDNDAKVLAVSINGNEIAGLKLNLGEDSKAVFSADTIRLQAGAASSNNAGAYFDNITAVAIPEPSTVGLGMGATVAMLLLLRKRGRKA